MITVANFKSFISNKSGGKPVSKIQDFYSMLYQAMIMVKGAVDLPSSIRTAQLVNPIYSDVDYYVVPDDLGMGGMINLRPIQPDDSFYDYQNFSQRQFTIENKFDNSNFTKRYAIKYKNGVPYLLISGTGTDPLIISNCESLTDNGTWGVYGVATNIDIDETQTYAGNASIEFDVNVGGAQGIQNTTLTSVDLDDQDFIFFAVYLPSITEVTGVRLGIGQNTGQYWTATATTDFFGNALGIGWNLVSIAKDSFTAAVGSPVWDGIVFSRFEVLGTFTSEIVGVHFDNLVANVGAIVEIDYYSDYSFADSSMAFKQMPTSDSDYIVMDGTELPLLLNQFTEIMAADLKQSGATMDINVYGGVKLKDQYEQFRIDYPSQRQLMITKYSNRPRFDVPDQGLRGW